MFVKQRQIRYKIAGFPECLHMKICVRVRLPIHHAHTSFIGYRLYCINIDPVGILFIDSYDETKKSVAVPGTSEHATGLALDITSESNQTLDETQAQTQEQQWLMKNCQNYGFILRYPKDKTDITQYIYEPWHYRYVGEEAAKAIMKKGITLEEYLAQIQK